MTEPAKAPVTYTIVGMVQEISSDYFTIDGIGARFFCKHDLLPYDHVKITIQKEAQCPPSATTQPEPSSNF